MLQESLFRTHIFSLPSVKDPVLTLAHGFIAFSFNFCSVFLTEISKSDTEIFYDMLFILIYLFNDSRHI